MKSTISMRTISFKETEALLERAADLISSIVKVVVPIASILGAIVLVAYLNRSGAGLPPDGASALFLLFLAATLTTVFGIMVLILLLPGASKMMLAGENTRKLFGELFAGSPRRPGWVWAYTKAYLSFYPPFLAFMLVMVASTFLVDRFPGALAPMLGLAMVGAVIGLVAIYRVRNRSLAGFGEFLLASSFASFVSVFAVVFIASFLTAILSDAVAGLQGIPMPALVIVFFAALVGLHWAMNIAAFTPLQLSAASGALLIFAVLFWPGPSYVGGIALRVLGSGGHLPVTLMVKSTKADGGAEPVTGCLILNSSSQVILRPTTVRAECRPLLPSLASEDRPGPFAGVVNYGAGEIATISEFVSRSSDGTAE